MINFDYSLRTIRFDDVQNGTFVMLNDKSENLYLKIERVREISILSPDRVCEYNCYNLSTGELKCIPNYTKVIVCDVDMTARPQR